MFLFLFLNISCRILHGYFRSITTSKANLYVFGISRFTKNHQYQIRLSKKKIDLFKLWFLPSSHIYIHIYIHKYMVPKSFKKYYDGKCSHSTFSMRKAKTITQIRPDD